MRFNEQLHVVYYAFMKKRVFSVLEATIYYEIFLFLRCTVRMGKLIRSQYYRCSKWFSTLKHVILRIFGKQKIVCYSADGAFYENIAHA